MQTLSIVIPAYNEELRLPRTFGLLEAALKAGLMAPLILKEVLVIDDGSQDGTTDVCQRHMTQLKELKSIRVSPNQGKGNAIHVGLKSATGDFVLIADADSATPWDQFQKLWPAILRDQSAIAIASRDLPESDVRTKQSWVREHMGKIFNLIVRMITRLPYRDTQCGFKLIERKSILSFLDQLRVKRFAWDVELLMFARKNKIKISEVPVAWEHQDASRVHAIRDASEMLLRVIEMRIRI